MVLSILSSFSVTEIMLFKSEVSNRNLRKVGVYSKGDRPLCRDPGVRGDEAIASQAISAPWRQGFAS